jgi:phytoene dehydrogenase-like protein
MADAVVIGAGPNGLVAANLLADEGWEVEVVEEQPRPGGAVRTEELTLPGFRHDVFSAFYPLAVASHVIRGLGLERYGLRWCRAPLVLAHPTQDGRCAVLSEDLEETAASLDGFASGDGDAWRRLYELWRRTGGHLIEALLTPFPPVAAGSRIVRAVGGAELVRFLRFGLLPVRRLSDEEFRGPGGGLLLAGSALHADHTPDSSGGSLFGWLLCGIGQERGWPVPEGGAGAVTDALVRRLESRGGRLRCGLRADEVLVSRGRAVGVRTKDGDVGARRAVLADVGAPSLYLDLVDRGHLPSRLLDDLRRFQYDTATVKVDWALDGPVPWEAEGARRAGTIHISEGMDALTDYSAQLATGRVPDHPFLVFGQYGMADPTRAPEGAETAWAYTHVPHEIKGDAGSDGLAAAWDERETEALVARIENEVEALAPGFRGLIRGRHVLTPPGMEARNANLKNGALNGGTAQLHQQLAFRPTSGLGRSETPVRGLYLASASAHPGGGVHGGPGANAARAALGAARPWPAGLGNRAALAITRRMAGATLGSAL